MKYHDYYAVLGVERSATQDDIKQAYRRMARKYHPDVSKEANAEEQFKNVQEAYEVLKDPEKRKAYDQLGENWKQGQDFRPPPEWNQQTQFHRSHGQQFTEQEFAGFSDFFSNLFGGGQGGFEQQEFVRRKQRGQDQHALLSIPLEDAFHGIQKTFQLQVPEIDTTGRQRVVSKTIKVTIPPGIKPGQQLRLAHQGAPSWNGGTAGDLYLEVAFDQHPLYSLEGNDIYLTLPVTPWEAALGANIQTPTLAGIVGLKINSGSQSGQKLRLKGRGWPSKPTAGDQYVILQIKTPNPQTEEQKQIYEKMASAMPFNPRQQWFG